LLRKETGHNVNSDLSGRDIDLLDDVVDGGNEDLPQRPLDYVDIVLDSSKDIDDDAQFAAVCALNRKSEQLKAVVLTLNERRHIGRAYLKIRAPELLCFLPLFDTGQLEAQKAAMIAASFYRPFASRKGHAFAPNQHAGRCQRVYFYVPANAPGADHASYGDVPGRDIFLADG